jgi:hypothetical protein
MGWAEKQNDVLGGRPYYLQDTPPGFWGTPFITKKCVEGAARRTISQSPISPPEKPIRIIPLFGLIHIEAAEPALFRGLR